MWEKREEPESKRDRAAAKRRERILEAAIMCFLEDGYHQTGVRDIAKRAGISLGNLYNHFPGKHDVLVEIAALERAELEPFVKLLAKTGPAPAIVDKFITAYAKYLAAPENIILTIEIGSEAIRKPDVAEMFLANREVLVVALAGVLKRGIAEEDFRKVPDLRETSQLIIELIESSAYRAFLGHIALRKLLTGTRDFIAAALRNG